MRFASILMLLLLVLPGTGCQDSSSPGTFAVVFDWGTVTPEEGTVLYAYGKIERRNEPDRPGMVIAECREIFPYQKEVSLAFSEVPNGENYTLVIELKSDRRKSAQTLYWGESESFSIKPGNHVEVGVKISFTPIPSLLGKSGNIQLTDARGNSLTVEAGVSDTTSRLASPVCNIAFQASNAYEVVLANDISMSAGAQTFIIADLQKNQDDSIIELWNLNDGLCGTSIPCIDGPRFLYLQFRDERGYESERYGFLVTVDTTGPYLPEGGSSVFPSFAKNGDQVRVIITPNEILSVPPELTILPNDPGFTLQTTTTDSLNTYTFLYIVDENADEKTKYSFSVSMTDVLQNTSESVPVAGLLEVDNQPVEIKNFTISTSRLAPYTGKDEVTATFSLAEIVPEAGVQGLAGNTKMTCIADESGLEWSCKANIETEADEDYFVPIQINVFDDAGNISTAGETLMIDVTSPYVDSILGPYITANQYPTLFPNITALSHNSMVIFSFYSTEEITEEQIITGDPCTVRVEKTGGSGNFYSYSLQLEQQTSFQGVCGIDISMEDIAGNRNTDRLFDIAVNTQVPDSPNISLINYIRAPFGTLAFPGQRSVYAVTGTSGAVAANAMITVLDRRNIDEAIVLAHTTAGENGAFSVMLDQTNRDRVFVVPIDTAGNIQSASEEHSHAYEVERIRWYSAVSNHDINNPHHAYMHTQAPAAGITGDSNFRNEFSEPQYQLIGNPAEGYLDTNGIHWQIRHHYEWGDNVPAEMDDTLAAYHADSGKLYIADPTAAFSMWVWDEHFFTVVPVTNGFPTAYDDAYMFYNASAHEIQLLNFTTLTVWQLSNNSWRKICEGVEASVQTETAVYDRKRGKLVAFAVTPQGIEAWEFDGQQWHNASEGGVLPPPRNRFCAGFHHRQGYSLIVGGSTTDSFDAWSWDGQQWEHSSVQSPSQHLEACTAVYDDIHESLWVFGGNALSDAPEEYWKFNGEQWSLTSVNNHFGNTLNQSSFRAHWVPGQNAIGIFHNDYLNYWLMDTQKEIITKKISYNGTLPSASIHNPLVNSDIVFTLLDYNWNLWNYDGLEWNQTSIFRYPAYQHIGYAALYYPQSILDGSFGSGLMHYGGNCTNTAYVLENESFEWAEINFEDYEAGNPPALNRPAIVYDARWQRFVLFGGLGNSSCSTPTDKTWVFDGDLWRQHSFSASPPARYGHAMHYNYADETIYIAGGFSDSQSPPLHDFWKLNWIEGYWEPLPDFSTEQTDVRLDETSTFTLMSLQNRNSIGLLVQSVSGPTVLEYKNGTWKELTGVNRELVGNILGGTYSEQKNELLMIGDDGLVSGHLLKESIPGVTYYADLNGADFETLNLNAIEVLIDAGGTNGNTRGCIVSLWDNYAGSWKEEIRCDHAADAPGNCRVFLEHAGLEKYIDDKNNFVYVLVTPAANQNNSYEPAELRIGYIEVSLDLQTVGDYL